MYTTDPAPADLRRADFLALVQAALGLLFAVLAALAVAGDAASPLSSDAWAWGIAAVGWFASAALLHLRPALVGRGTEPAPRRWFELAGVAVVGLVLAAVAAWLFGWL